MKLSTRIAIPLAVTFTLLSVTAVGLLAAQEHASSLAQADRDLDVAATVMAARAANELQVRQDALRFLANATSQTEVEVALVEDEHLQYALWQGNVLNLMAQRSAVEFDALYVTDAHGREMWRYEGGEMVVDQSRLLDHAGTPTWAALASAPSGMSYAWVDGDQIHFATAVQDLRGRVVGLVGGNSYERFLTGLADEHVHGSGFASTDGGSLGRVSPIPSASLSSAQAGVTEHDDALMRALPAFRLQAPGEASSEWHAVARAELAPIHAMLLQKVGWLVAGTTLTLVGVIAVVLVVVRRALRPLYRLTSAVDQLQSGQDAAPMGGSDELDELALKLRDRGRHDAEARAKLEKFATLGSLSAGVAHEVNNPLAFMRSTCELSLLELDERLERQDLGAEEREVLVATRKTLGKNVEGIDRIARIVQSLRLLAKPAPERRPMDVGQVVQATIEVAGPRLKTVEGIEVRMDDGLVTAGSPDTMGQVVLNLLLNAADATPRTGGRVWIDGRRVGGRIELRVSDNGPGVRADMRPKLFAPFATTKASGTGLGLSISLRIVHEHGGELRYEDRAGGGACFIIELPVREASAPAVPTAKTATLA